MLPRARDRSAEAGVVGVNRRRPLESARGESRAKSVEESTSRGPFRFRFEQAETHHERSDRSAHRKMHGAV